MLLSFDQASFTTGLTLLPVLVLLTLVVRAIFIHRKYPTAPGAKLGAFSHWSYVWQVWKGDFEKWNIEQHAQHGKIIRVAPDMYSIDDPEAVNVIYSVTSPMIKSEWYSAWGDPRIPNHNLFSDRDPKFHAHMRRMVGNMYSMTTIKSYEPYVDRCIFSLFNQLDQVAHQGEVMDLQRWMQCYAFDVIGELTFSRSIGFVESGGKDIDGIMASIDRMTEFSLFLGLDSRLLPLLLMKFGFPQTGLERWTDKLTTSRRTAPIDEENEPLSRNAEDFVAKLEKLREKNPADFETYHCDRAKMANVLAGSDTTSISLTAIMYYLSADQPCFEKLRREILDATKRGELDNPVTFDQAQKLPYLQAVIKEGIRLHPATGLPMWRVVPKGGVTVAGTFFPEGTQIGINTWVAHHNSQIFGTDSTSFRPERWLVDPTDSSSAERIALMERYYIPFGAGTRTCIGKNISILEMAKLIPELVRRYNFELLMNSEGEKEMSYQNRWFVKQKDLYVRMRRAT